MANLENIKREHPDGDVFCSAPSNKEPFSLIHSNKVSFVPFQRKIHHTLDLVLVGIDPGQYVVEN
jgi:hypothetical protein